MNLPHPVPGFKGRLSAVVIWAVAVVVVGWLSGAFVWHTLLGVPYETPTPNFTIPADWSESLQFHGADGLGVFVSVTVGIAIIVGVMGICALGQMIYNQLVYGDPNGPQSISSPMITDEVAGQTCRNPLCACPYHKALEFNWGTGTWAQRNICRDQQCSCGLHWAEHFDDRTLLWTAGAEAPKPGDNRLTIHF